METHRILYGLGAIIGLFVIGILPWILAFKNSKGASRHKVAGSLCQAFGMILMFGVLSFLALTILGDRSNLPVNENFLSAILLVIVFFGTITLGPYFGGRFFVFVMKNKLGKVGAEQILRRSS